jgi:outer membrane protein OmpA-like peptidoglycan-associated protein
MRCGVLIRLLACGLAGLSCEGANAQVRDVGGSVVDLVYPAPLDLRFTVVDLGGKTQSLEAKTQSLQVKETATEVRINLAADVLFDFDKSTIKPEAAKALHDVAQIIIEKGGGRTVRIEGHTDSKGGAAYNQRLSERRADAVKQWLMRTEGLAKVRMTTRGFGATRPVAPNTKPDGSDDPVGRQKNRRVEIVLEK